MFNTSSKRKFCMLNVRSAPSPRPLPPSPPRHPNSHLWHPRLYPNPFLLTCLGPPYVDTKRTPTCQHPRLPQPPCMFLIPPERRSYTMLYYPTAHELESEPTTPLRYVHFFLFLPIVRNAWRECPPRRRSTNSASPRPFGRNGLIPSTAPERSRR